MSKIVVSLIGAAAIAALIAPASAQPATANQSWEGATHEMQRRGPASSLRGPMSDGRIVVTPGYQRYHGRYVKRYHRSHRYYGMAR
jgi:hypothetical protein